MKKSELKTGMVVETEAEGRYQVMLNTPHGDVLQGDDGYNKLNLYKEDLKVSGRTSMGFDTVAVYSTPSNEKGYRRPLSNFTRLLWKRPDAEDRPKLDPKSVSFKEFLKLAELFYGRKVTITINPEE